MKRKYTSLIKEQGKKLLLSVLLASLLCMTVPKQFLQHPPVTAWWGSLYPKFCFGEIEKEYEIDSVRERPKISFYLAKLLDW